MSDIKGFFDAHSDDLENIYNKAISYSVTLDRNTFIEKFRPLLWELKDTCKEAQQFYKTIDKEEFVSKLRKFVSDTEDHFHTNVKTKKPSVKSLKTLFKSIKNSGFTSPVITKTHAHNILQSLSDDTLSSKLSLEERILIKGACLEALSNNELNQIAQAISYFTDIQETERKHNEALGRSNKYLIFSKKEKKSFATFLTYNGSFRSLLRNMLSPEMMKEVNKHPKCPKNLKFEEDEKGDYIDNLEDDYTFKLKSMYFLEHIMNTELYCMEDEESYQVLSNKLGIAIASVRNDFSKIKKMYKY